LGDSESRELKKKKKERKDKKGKKGEKGYHTVRSRDRPAATCTSVRHMMRLETASMEELGSSRRSTGGLPIGY
jgi:hypothetical protein